MEWPSVHYRLIIIKISITVNLVVRPNSVTLILYQMKWGGLMNNYRRCAEEVVFDSIIYT